MEPDAEKKLGGPHGAVDDLFAPLDLTPDAFGTYVHIPFCSHRCDYCDFATWVDRSHLIDDYVDACVKDIHRQRREGLRDATSIFFGGGTPTQLPTSALVKIIQTLRETLGITLDAEVTLEANPNDVLLHDWNLLRDAGVNRVSFGVQSFNPSVLRMIDRTHAPEDAATALETVRSAGITNLSIDLMFGLPRQTLADWRRTLEHAFALDVPHLSIYGLILEERYTAKLKAEYPDLPPVYITENGMANADTLNDGQITDQIREDYLFAHLAATKRAIEAGANVKGFFYWSLLDNYEWAEGYEKRFGLVHVDFNTLERTPKSSYHALARALARND